jgi:hypothetical protein
MIENKNSAFIVRERVEGLEKLVNQALEIDGLKDMAKDERQRSRKLQNLPSRKRRNSSSPRKK